MALTMNPTTDPLAAFAGQMVDHVTAITPTDPARRVAVLADLAETVAMANGTGQSCTGCGVSYDADVLSKSGVPFQRGWNADGGRERLCPHCA